LSVCVDIVAVDITCFAAGCFFWRSYHAPRCRIGAIAMDLSAKAGIPGRFPVRTRDGKASAVGAVRGEADEAVRRSDVEIWIKQMGAAGLAPGTIRTRYVNVRPAVPRRR